eukprot:3227418-Pyramimonas_sp.AAC.1
MTPPPTSSFLRQCLTASVLKTLQLISRRLATIQVNLWGDCKLPSPPRPKQPRPTRKWGHARHVLEDCKEGLRCRICFRYQLAGQRAPWLDKPCA